MVDGVRIDELNPTISPALDFKFPAMKDGATVHLTVQQVSDLIRALILDGAPEAFDTLAELAAALNDDEDFAATVTAALALKASSADVTAALALKADAATRGRVLLGSGTIANGSAVCDITLPSGYKSLELVAENVEPVGAPDTLYARFSFDGGSSYAMGATDYLYAAQYAVSSGTITGAFQSGAGASAIRLATSQAAGGVGIGSQFGLLISNEEGFYQKVRHTWTTKDGAAIVSGRGSGFYGSGTLRATNLRLVYNSCNMYGGKYQLYGEVG